jgi:hypothetical protein
MILFEYSHDDRAHIFKRLDDLQSMKNGFADFGLDG